MSLRKAKSGEKVPARERRPMSNNIKMTTNLNRETGRYETHIGGEYWHPKYSVEYIREGIKHGKLIVWKIIGDKVYLWTEGLRKIKMEPILNPNIPEGCHNLAVMDTSYLDRPVAEWKFRWDRRA